jgi:hypothetical protein
VVAFATLLEKCKKNIARIDAFREASSRRGICG